MPHVKIWVHIVWATKRRQPLLSTGIRQKVFDHIKENAKFKKIYVDKLNGHADHVHCLISLGFSQNIETVVQLLKGESSFWINRQKLVAQKFEWQKGYFAVSVSESGLEKLRAYIDNQEAHHEKKAFVKEYEVFMEMYGFENIDGGD